MGSRTLTALALAGGLALAGCGGTNSSSGGSSSGSGAADKGPIKIGAVVPLTGPYSPLGTGDKAAIEQEVKRINAAGGVLGRQLDVTVVDDKSDVTQSVTEYNKMAADKSYSAILSSSNASASAAVGPSAISTKTPTLALSPISAYSSGSNPYAFTVPATPEVYSAKMAEYFAAAGIKTLAIAYNGKDIYGKTGNESTKAAVAKNGINVVVDEPIDPGSTDFTPLIQKVKDAKPDAFLVWCAGPAPVIITKQFQGAGIKLVLTGANASNLFTKPAGPAAEGVVMGSSIAVAGAEVPAGPLKSEIDTFAQPWLTANSNVYPPQFAFDGVTGIRLLKAAIEKAKSSDREAIRNALESLDVLTPIGHFTYSKTDHAGLQADAIAMVEVKGGAFVATDFTKQQFATNLPK
ncbi:MAG TPA: ABC transporter substrate-binding protein [Kineosporiaceae bacterium]|nr:ABC transporter substrate-binding protein [Kineosporiaceae bacterium]